METSFNSSTIAGRNWLGWLTLAGLLVILIIVNLIWLLKMPVAGDALAIKIGFVAMAVLLLFWMVRYYQLKTNNQSFQSKYQWLAFDETQDAIWVFNKKQEIIAFNKTARQFTGNFAALSAPMSIEELLLHQPVQTIALFQQVVNDVFTTKEKARSPETVRLIGNDCQYHNFSISIVPLLADKNNCKGVLLFLTDVTAQQQSKKSAQIAEERINDLIDKLPEAVYTCDETGRILHYNKQATKLWGREPVKGEEKWCGSWKIYNTDATEVDLATCPMAIAIKEGRPVNGKQIIVKRPDGTIRHVLPHPRPLLNSTGTILGAVNTLVDVTERKEHEILLLQSEERYRTVIEQASEAIFITDAAGNLLEVNNRACQMLGYTKEVLKAMNVKDLFSKEALWAYASKNMVIQGSETVNWDCVILANGGKTLLAGITAKSLSDGRYMAIVRDITALKQAEQALKDSEAFNRSILASLTSHIAVVDEFGNIVAVNKAWSSFAINNGALSLERSGVGENYFEVCEKAAAAGDTLAAKVLQGVKSVLAKKTTLFEQEYPCHSAKEERWFLLRVMNFIGDQPKVVLIHIDITERKRAEVLMQAALERFNILAKATSDTIWDWNIENDCISYNNGIYKMFGYDIIAVEKMSDWWKTNIHPDDRYRVNHLLETAFKGQQETVQLQYRYRCANKTYKFILDRAFIIYNEAGKPVRVIGAMQDVSVEKQQEIIVGKAIIDAQERERQQIGMELHDNVTQILSAAQLYLELAATEYTDLNQVTKTIKSGKGFIADAITEIRRLSHQLAPASFKNVSLEEVFTSLINSMNSSQQFQVDMKFEQFEKELVSEDIQINLYRILQEQLHNIVKYAHPAKVSVRVVVNNNNIELTIIDDGKGFDTSNYQAGIGLKNIKRRANVFDGNFYINSSLGKGCELKVQLPLKRAS